ncbi:GAF domain-containing protein [Tateyamaria omphalii]|uniref:GAF domain-containing protein n=1 Tax=Tateyamaria omphalii TaxID=299262 RepID=A0A1P8MR79_9RHOB|nr:GAF domain-containing protein [Tateyamaria omphalii]APX10586.1 GAF domain-containing protein [Tateyamaria omphalii]
METASPDAFFAKLHENIGGRLFTVTVLDRKAGLAQRVYSSDPEAYPVSGTKPMSQGAWTDMVINRAETFVANTVAEFAIYFGDHALIESLGCQSALNVPVLDNDQVIGTVNVLDQEHHFTPERVQRCQSIVQERRDELVATLRGFKP